MQFLLLSIFRFSSVAAIFWFYAGSMNKIDFFVDRFGDWSLNYVVVFFFSMVIELFSAAHTIMLLFCCYLLIFLQVQRIK